MSPDGGLLRSALLGASVIVAAIALAPAAGAQPGWSLPPVTLSVAAPLGWPPVLGGDGAGNATALYATASSYSPGAETLLAQDHPLGGPWGAAQTLGSGGNASGAALAVNPAGDMTAVWVDHAPGAPEQVWTVSRTRGAAWGASTHFALTGTITDTVGSPGIAEDPQGNAVAVWSESNQQHTSTWLLAARRQAGVWGAPTRLSGAGARVYDETPAQVSVDGDGGFVVVWSQFLAPSIVSVEAQELLGGVWRGEQTIESGGDSLYAMALGENAAGEATALWVDLQKGSIHAATLRNGAFSLNSPAATHLYAACEAPPPRVAVDGAGNTLGAWVDESGQLVAQTLSATGSWREPAQNVSAVPSGDHASDPHVALDPAGDVIATWTYFDGATNRRFTQAAWRAAGSDWGAPVTLSGPDAYNTAPSLSMDAQGNAVEVWAATAEGQNYAVRAAGFEVAPVVASLQLPLRATQRQTASFSTGATTPWGTLASAHWDFGDGAGADGASVTHAYARPGLYTVILTLTDGLLNKTTISRQVTVTANPQPYVGAAPSGSLGAASGSGGASGGGHLLPVYLVAHKQRLWLGRGSHNVAGWIRNTNAFGVTGTATMTESAAVGSAGATTPRTMASVRFKLPAQATGRVVFHLTKAAVGRLRAQRPEKGHNLVRVRLAIGGAGLSATGVGSYALDGPSLARPVSQVRPGIALGTVAAPVVQWPRDAC